MPQADRKQPRKPSRIACDVSADTDRLVCLCRKPHRSFEKTEHRRRGSMVVGLRARAVTGGSGEILRKIVCPEREEIRRFEGVQHQRGGRHLHHHADRRDEVGHAAAGKMCGLLAKYRPHLVDLGRKGHHRQHDAKIAVNRGTQQRACLHAGDFRLGEQETDAAQVGSGKRIAEPGQRLVAADVEHADCHGSACRPFQDTAIDGKLFVFVRCIGDRRNREFRPHQSNARGRRWVDSVQLGGIVDVDGQEDLRSISRAYFAIVAMACA